MFFCKRGIFAWELSRMDTGMKTDFLLIHLLVLQFICSYTLTDGVEMDPCKRYTHLQRIDQRLPTKTAAFGATICDRYINEGWYRAESAKMTESVPKLLSCSTTFPVYLSGPHPTQADGITLINACKRGLWGTCTSKFPIRVKNCGEFYVYYLRSTETCSSAYCFEYVEQDEAATTTTTPPLPQRSDISCNADSIDTFVPISMLPSGAPLTWRDPTCSITSNGTHMISSIGLSQCGTTVTITKDNVEFENELKAQSTNSTANSLIDFGEDAYVIPVKCIYPRTETPMTSYVPLQQHVRFYEKRYGHFDVDIMQYDSDKFSSAIQNLGTPRKVALNSEIYVEVKLNDQFNNGLGIHIDKCIATPTSSPSDSTLYTLLTDGCPASQHVHLYNSPANKVRFGVRAFQFTSQTGAMVYIHCQTSMCQAGTPYCTSNCVTAGRRKRDVAPDQKSHLVSAGPFVLVADEQGTPIRMSTIVASVSAFVAVVACVVAIVGWTRKTRTTSTKEQGLL